MDEILVFVENHWQMFVQLGFSLISLIIYVCCKKVKIIDYFSGLLNVLPSYIRDAEDTGEDGRKKFTYVFNRCVNYLIVVTGKSSDIVLKKYASCISDAIENILATPEKGAHRDA